MINMYNLKRNSDNLKPSPRPVKQLRGNDGIYTFTGEFVTVGNKVYPVYKLVNTM